VESMLERGTEAALAWLEGGIERAMNEYNA
jgi:hypothetical protein